jgi:hypothetical protein
MFIEREIEHEHIHARLAEDTEKPSLGVCGDHLLDALERKVIRARHTRRL